MWTETFVLDEDCQRRSCETYLDSMKQWLESGFGEICTPWCCISRLACGRVKSGCRARHGASQVKNLENPYFVVPLQPPAYRDTLLSVLVVFTCSTEERTACIQERNSSGSYPLCRSRGLWYTRCPCTPSPRRRRLGSSRWDTGSSHRQRLKRCTWASTAANKYRSVFNAPTWLRTITYSTTVCKRVQQENAVTCEVYPTPTTVLIRLPTSYKPCVLLRLRRPKRRGCR